MPSAQIPTMATLEALAKPGNAQIANSVKPKAAKQPSKPKQAKSGPNPAKASIPQPSRGGSPRQQIQAAQQPASFKRGGKVKKTAVYKLHKGERVLNPKQTAKAESLGLMSALGDNDADKKIAE